jgi:VWFA-related protein
MRVVPAIATGLLCLLGTLSAQEIEKPFTIPVRVNEVNVDFSALDGVGRWIEDLQVADLRVTDNGKSPDRIVSFRKRTNLPVRAGILVDMSRSMLHDLSRNRRIVAMLAEHVLRLNEDRAFVMRFDFETKLQQAWTSDGEVLNASMATVGRDWESRLGGTAIFDSLYRACRDQFGGSNADKDGNFILLFSDGLDNASRARLDDVVDRCQQSHTAIYAFSDAAKSSHDGGEKVLRDLAGKTGGRVFYEQNDEGRLGDLRAIEGEVRNQYQIVYKPAQFKADGSFHRIKIDCPKRAALLHMRSGYYAR